MRLKTDAGRWSGRTEAASRLPHKVEVLGPYPACPVMTVVMQEFTQYDQAIFPEQISELAVGAGLAAAGPEQRLLDNAEIKPAGMKSSLCVVPHCRFTHKVRSNEPSSLGNREIALRVDHISDRRPARAFANGFHAQRKRHLEVNFKTFRRCP